MTSQKTPTIKISHNLQMQARHLIYLACKIPQQTYQNRGFLILPDLPSGNTENIVIFPDLNYSKIHNFWQRTAKLTLWTPIEAPKNLISETSRLIKPIYNSSQLTKIKNHLETQLKTYQSQFFQAFFNFFPQYQKRIKQANIYLTQFGSPSNFRLTQKNNDHIDIFLRQNSGLVKLFEAVLTCIFRPKLEKLSFSWKEIESIIDFLLLESSFLKTSKKFQGTIPSLKNQQQAKLKQQSQTYLNKLGITPKRNLQQKNNEFYFSNQKITNLSEKEHLLLEVLLTKSPKTAKFNEIMDHLWPNNEEITQWAVTKQIQRLRNKLKQNGISIPVIQADRGKGYSII